jgi:hypothetical protein
LKICVSYFSLFYASLLPIQRPLFDHLEEGGVGLKPYCDLLPGGKFGFFFQQMQNLYFYMLMLSNNNSIDERTVSKLNSLQPFDDFKVLFKFSALIVQTG